ncbi:CcoQ/FixQ family Cbb3-type cytochrome c oxidase assembly chaperone [Pacificitalea manganoxidans]|uniref:CcoQ/FixQ family Cbb3-type cytochrome c oxidase assembly chaperone n=1 Tax=Pacificitalea manganoxidans TaxID=1411902 RepID=A0A291LY19_9RHOB|nr:cbb3-type cytochrome c oxidase subunit 3 [Pacificitalea manganoxidans]MAQ44407.1 cbb3-type cytochrome c oxidase subunit 3 [Actibacterium sp.]OWU71185.1 cytochrome oxidase [Roseovarius sp. 22II1-1F6A]ATI41591.1 CcoQ/FixQ family Cbb3-type cytochrome c oxidase assembly chaperone [Pacificitalea manganoxidans]MBF51930.1 cbb3-type cytochrome c oxidase subunit 3 [Actibacterium sp.]MDR6309018.1 cytochrome c oxidase cbb3-type subunit 4 [Pacificitalea manganoxidans]|tara:strand:+ start:646 stop:849 length:204 start_codon:yes stop_codon:yes gene_type:complete
MDTYSYLRHLADSWALLVLTLIFLGVIGWCFRPGSRALHDDAADVPFRHDRPDTGRADIGRTEGASR